MGSVRALVASNDIVAIAPLHGRVQAFRHLPGITEALSKVQNDDDLHRLATAKNPAVRRQTVLALTRRDGKTRKLLEPAIEDSDARIRRLAISALRLHGDQSIRAIVKATNDADPVVAIHAVYALGSIGTSKAINALIGTVEKTKVAPRFIIESLYNTGEGWLKSKKLPGQVRNTLRYLDSYRNAGERCDENKWCEAKRRWILPRAVGSIEYWVSEVANTADQQRMLTQMQTQPPAVVASGKKLFAALGSHAKKFKQSYLGIKSAPWRKITSIILSERNFHTAAWDKESK